MSQTISIEDQNNIDSLLQIVDRLESNPEILCDEECQNSQVERKLYNDYVASKSNLESAPIQFENAEEKYLKFKYGNNGYMDRATKLVEERIQPEIDSIVKTFNNKLELAKSYNTNQAITKDSILNINSSQEIMERNITKNEKVLEDNINQTQMADSKVHYKNQTLSLLTDINYYADLVFYISFLIVAVYVLFFKGKYNDWKYYAMLLGIYFLQPIVNSIIEGVIR